MGLKSLVDIKIVSNLEHYFKGTTLYVSKFIFYIRIAIIFFSIQEQELSELFTVIF